MIPKTKRQYFVAAFGAERVKEIEEMLAEKDKEADAAGLEKKSRTQQPALPPHLQGSYFGWRLGLAAKGAVASKEAPAVPARYAGSLREWQARLHQKAETARAQLGRAKSAPAVEPRPSLLDMVAQRIDLAGLNRAVKELRGTR